MDDIDETVQVFLGGVAGPTRRWDADTLLEVITQATGVGCLYIKDLDKTDLGVLKEIIDTSYRTVTSGTFGHRAADSHRGRPAKRPIHSDVVPAPPA